jgi:sugar lactone lactonase YvrE
MLHLRVECRVAELEEVEIRRALRDESLAPSRLLKVAPDGTQTVVIDNLTRPGSVALGPDGAIYISNRSTSIGTGEVLRVDP